MQHVAHLPLSGLSLYATSAGRSIYKSSRGKASAPAVSQIVPMSAEDIERVLRKIQRAVA